MPKQINIFVDNKPGKLKTITQILSSNGVDIKAVTIQDRKEFGMVKLLVNDPEKAHVLLQDNGFASALKDILVVIIEDKPGGLLQLAEAFEKHSINIIDAYSYTVQSHQKAVWCSEVDDYERARSLLKNDGFTLISDEDLAGL